jgi:hypothetical protein
MTTANKHTNCSHTKPVGLWTPDGAVAKPVVENVYLDACATIEEFDFGP